jgi:hypothetical protein
MTNFLDARALWGSGHVANAVQPKAWTGGNNYADHSQYIDLAPADLQSFIHGQNVLIGTHGFNVNRQDGIETMQYWETLLGLPVGAVFLGFLWPGDSEFFHALSYPVEPKHATAAGNLLAKFADDSLADAASVSFVSHSLGARVVLQAISQMKLPVRRLILMAGAINDDCLTAEFAAVPAKVGTISLLASAEDEVLRWAFPLGDFVAEIIGRDHPWWESALGRSGPRSRPANYRSPCQIPKGWNFGHGNYLQTDPPAPAPIPPPTDVPEDGPPPLGGVPGWQEAWSAAFASTRFQ